MRMIPSYCDEYSPPGEKIIFSMLEKANKDWIVIHSLDVAPYNKNRRTEIDFLIIIPNQGILCVEVKSHKGVYLDVDGWHPGTLSKRDPFAQAKDARFAFRRALLDNLGSKYRHVPVMHLCIFACSNVDLGSTLSIKSWEYLDKRSLSRTDRAEGFCKDISQSFSTSIDQDPDVSPLKSELKASELDSLLQFCRPIRKRIPDADEEIKERKARLDSILRAQQSPVLTLVDLNKRVLVSGGAGTGKSLIGMEVARRKAETGLRVAYICYNNLIGNWVANELSKDGRPNLIAGSAYKILLELSEVELPDSPGHDWWESTAPIAILEKLTSPDVNGSIGFDYIVIDEFQDILARPELWACLQLLFDQSVDASNSLLLGDFDNQVLTLNTDLVRSELTKLSEFYCKWHLHENCRNYEAIGSTSLRLSGLKSSPWSGYMRAGGGFESLNIVRYENEAKHIEIIKSSVDKLIYEGFKHEDIVVLGFHSGANVLERLKKKGVTITAASSFNKKTVTYSTASRFKGMESPVIILCDIYFSPENIELQRRMFYTAMTRATEKLIICCRDSAATTLAQWFNN